MLESDRLRRGEITLDSIAARSAGFDASHQEWLTGASSLSFWLGEIGPDHPRAIQFDHHNPSAPNCPIFLC